MVLAELEVVHSVAGSPTRRLALGRTPPDGDGPARDACVLVAMVVQQAWPHLDADQREEVRELLHDVRCGRSLPPIVLRHRLQYDTVGLRSDLYQLVAGASGTRLRCVDDHGRGVRGDPVCAAAGALWLCARTGDAHLADAVAAGVEAGTSVSGAHGDPLVGALWSDPRAWARDVLGVDEGAGVDEVRQAFRLRLREAHPDVAGGGRHSVDDLVVARRTLLDAAR